jgi:type I restriction enzyme M protein
MLDTATKRRIDTARDILVGKVPDPKSQVEQITIALIYKFMDDMDAESEELGGKRAFFAGEYGRYGWAKLMRSGLGGHETLNLYGEAIATMPQNPGIPPLFRTIFKNAYLPYRDPETLKSFLKIIDEFEYDHSERLGDAFEYLLSVLGSQGDAGQFRTPRHIIDFMVQILDPQKEEVILDPACGTAGFLISSYKHILRANSDTNSNSTLTPDDKGRLARNFKGYDISPDMVRLSLVNLYLHGFVDPHIEEYDTLTSEEKWNEFADVILANPPFMSPKGGIKPHRRFSVQSKRSEVLFVDYMAEHLTPNGRAGIIVPEGIIFQSGTSYKQLRKMLVDKSLVAVISLPAGVFQPYSGVKTSILILDKSLARRSNSIAFFKVENDGFGLGAQRRAIEKNDLSAAFEFLKAWFSSIGSGREVLSSPNALIVPKEKIAGNGDYNLSGERYRENVASISAWPFVPVAQIFRKSERTVLPETLNGPVTYIGLENIEKNTGETTGCIVTENPSEIKSLKNIFKPSDILYGKLRPNLNKVWLADREGICSTDIFVIEPCEKGVEPVLYAYLFRSERFNDAVMKQLKGAQLPRVGWSSFAEIQIPLPPLEVQKEIVVEIEGYQKVINGARAVLDNYRPHIPIDPDWPIVSLADVSDFISGYAFKSTDMTTMPVDDSYRAVVKIGNVGRDGRLDMTDAQFNSYTNDLARFALCVGDIVMAMTGATVGKVAVVEETGLLVNQRVGVVRAKPKALQSFVFHLLCSAAFYNYCQQTAGGGAQGNIAPREILEYQISLPSLEIQQAIVAEIEAEQALVAANRELIERFEKKIQVTIARIWGGENLDEV